MLGTPGSCACDEMGAFVAGVFWGVLKGKQTSVGRIYFIWWRQASTHGAPGRSDFLILFGSDILIDSNLVEGKVLVMLEGPTSVSRREVVSNEDGGVRFLKVECSTRKVLEQWLASTVAVPHT